ncbi:MAG: RIP metalloprotease RseP, partial [Gemmatimonadetes bacterium]|nr:RIP metalloprotease RseP [Gemmatimonadota bacterium]
MMSLLAPILVIGILVFFHELGHFWVAKRSGIRVEAFSIGFGPQIFGFTRGETEYKVSWIPFGGYVKMAGEEPDDQGGDEPWRFHKKSVPVRSAVILAGPVANIILAIVVYALLYFTYGMPVYSTEIGWVLPDTPAERAGIQRGDRITAVAGEPVADFTELAEAIVARKDEALPILVTRGGSTVELSLTLGDASLIGIQPESPPVIGNVVPGGAADRAGMLSGDRIVRIGTESIARWSDLRLALQQDIGEELSIAWERAGVREETALKPDIFEESDA